MPQRIQRKRTKGWRMPEGAVCVGRPSAWGNPYIIGATCYGVKVTAENCLFLFEVYCLQYLREQPRWLDPLRGRDLACWCALDQPCHADVLLRLANAQHSSAGSGDANVARESL